MTALYTDKWIDSSIETVGENGILCRIQKRRNPDTHKIEQRMKEFTPQELTEKIGDLEDRISDMYYQASYEDVLY